MQYNSVASFLQEQTPYRKPIRITEFGSYTVVTVNDTKLYVGRVCDGERYTLNEDLTSLVGVPAVVSVVIPPKKWWNCFDTAERAERKADKKLRGIIFDHQG